MDGDDDRRSECGRSPYGIRLELETRAACRPVAVVAHVKRLAMSGGPGRAGVFAKVSMASQNSEMMLFGSDGRAVTSKFAKWPRPVSKQPRQQMSESENSWRNMAERPRALDFQIHVEVRDGHGHNAILRAMLRQFSSTDVVSGRT